MLTGTIDIPLDDTDAMHRALTATARAKSRETYDRAPGKTIVNVMDDSMQLDEVIELANAIAATGLRASLLYVDEDNHLRHFDILCGTAVCLAERTVLVPDKIVNDRLAGDEPVFQCLLGHEHMRQSAILQDAYRRG